jgi:Amt family ammonium transporter
MNSVNLKLCMNHVSRVFGFLSSALCISFYPRIPKHLENTRYIGHISFSIFEANSGMFVLFATAFLVFFILAGLCLIFAGVSRTKNAVSSMITAILALCFGAIGYWAAGFAFEFGGMNYRFPAANLALSDWIFMPPILRISGVENLAKPLMVAGNQVLGMSGFFNSLPKNSVLLAFFLFQMILAIITAVISTGAFLERIKSIGLVLVILWVSVFMFPLIGNWVWGGGWLANLGRSAGLGNGAVDFAGSGVIHITAGVTALAGAYVTGPRIGKFGRNGTVRSAPGHNMVYQVLGVLFLFAGSIGITTGLAVGAAENWQTLAISGAVNTFIAGAAGGLAGMVSTGLSSDRKKNPAIQLLTGVRAGLVASAASGGFVEIWACAVIGFIAGVLACAISLWLEKQQFDDPATIIPVHLSGGVWGVIAVGLFASGVPDTTGWNGIFIPVTGLLYGNRPQLLAQCIEVLSVVIIVGGLSVLYFRILSSLGLLRVPADIELEGLDAPEWGVMGYLRDWEPSPTALHVMPGCEGKQTTKPVAAE